MREAIRGVFAPRGFAFLDGLRAVAVLMVVVSHAGLGHVVPGGAGVTIFFTISGFIITYLVMRERERTGAFDIWRFYARRALKLAPPFVVIIALPSLAGVATGGLSGAGLASQALFVYNWRYLVAGKSDVLAGSHITWSLAIEEQFYIGFALVWFVMCAFRVRARALLMLGGVAIGLGAVSRIVLALDVGNSERIYYGTDTRVDAIAWGIVVAVAYGRTRAQRLGGTAGPRLTRLRNLGREELLVGGVIAFVLGSAVRSDFWQDALSYGFHGLAAVSFVTVGLMTRPWRWRRAAVLFGLLSHPAVVAVGLASYSIYLSHAVIFSRVESLSQALPLPVAATGLTALAVVVGVALYLAVEVPAGRLRRLRPEWFEPAGTGRIVPKSAEVRVPKGGW